MHDLLIKLFASACCLFLVCSGSALAQEQIDATQTAVQDDEKFIYKADTNDLFVFLDAVITASQNASCEEMNAAAQNISAEIKMRAARTIANIEKIDIDEKTIQEIDAKSSQIAKTANNCPALLIAHKNVATIAHSLEKHQKESIKRKTPID